MQCSGFSYSTSGKGQGISIPMLILHGQNDSLCNVLVSHTLHQVRTKEVY